MLYAIVLNTFTKLWNHQFGSVQSLSLVWRQASLSFTNSRSLRRLTSIKLVMPSSRLILCNHCHGPFPDLRLLLSDGPPLLIKSNQGPVHPLLLIHAALPHTLASRFLPKEHTRTSLPRILLLSGVTVCRVLLLQLAVSAQINHKLLRPGPRSHMPSVTPLSSPTHNTNLGTQKDPVSTRQWECLAGVTPGGTLEHKTRWELS